MPHSDAPGNEARKTTEIVTADNLDTPYPYCLIPQQSARGRSLSITRIRWAVPREQPRTVLSVSTWDGRDILNVRAGS